MAEAAYSGATAPHDAYFNGMNLDEEIRRAADLAGLVMTGGLAGTEAKAAEELLGSGAARKVSRLPMDEASRRARADALDFRRDLPLYHGSAHDFPAFDLSKANAMTKTAPAGKGVWAALDPETANEFAHLAAARSQGNAQIYPLLHRTAHPGVIELEGNELNHEIAATLDDAFSRGHDAVLLRNYTTPGGVQGKNILVVKDPAQLRSPFAAFDPAKKSSANLLAGVAGATAAPPVLNAAFQAAYNRGDAS